jgi:hypothetical protein
MEEAREEPRVTPPPFGLTGRTVLVATDGAVLELRIVASDDDGGFTAYAPRLLVREGLEVDARIAEDGQVWRLRYRIVSADVVNLSDAEVRLVPLESYSLGDERSAERVPYAGRAFVRSVYYEGYDIAPTPVHVTDLSTTGLAFESERRIECGVGLDLRLEAQADEAVVARIEVVRVEPGRFGRTRMMTRLTAISVKDELRLQGILARARLQRDSADASSDVVDASSLRSELGVDRPRGVLRLLRRRTA